MLLQCMLVTMIHIDYTSYTRDFDTAFGLCGKNASETSKNITKAITRNCNDAMTLTATIRQLTVNGAPLTTKGAML